MITAVADSSPDATERPGALRFLGLARVCLAPVSGSRQMKILGLWLGPYSGPKNQEQYQRKTHPGRFKASFISTAALLKNGAHDLWVHLRRSNIRSCLPDSDFVDRRPGICSSGMNRGLKDWSCGGRGYQSHRAYRKALTQT